MAVEASGPTAFMTTNNLHGFSDFLSTPDYLNVQNHLIDTKIYATIGENDVFHIRPSSLHFQSFKTSKKYSQKFRVINMSSECQRMHILQPTTKQFSIKYKKNGSLVPGMYLEVTVEFSPNENIYYYDCIRVHTEGISNLIIPIHAYPTLDVSSIFPSRVDFKPTMIGNTVKKKIPLQNDTEKDFEFQATLAQDSYVFGVSPETGLLPANGCIDIVVSYSPKEYCTSIAKLQIFVLQFNNQPFYCTLSGSSEPGLASKLKTKENNIDYSSSVADIKVQSPLERSRLKKLNPKSKNAILKTVVKSEKEIIKDGISFPKNLNNPAAVAYVLNQQPSKLKAKDLREAIQTRIDVSNTKQMKEAIFEHVVTKTIQEEQRNQLRWCVRLGEDVMTDAYQKKVFEDRENATATYKVNRGDPQVGEEYDRSVTKSSGIRVRREANKQAEGVPSFDIFLNNDWNQRHSIVRRFRDAARKVIIQSRASKNMKSIQTKLDGWRRGNFHSITDSKPKEKNNEEDLIVRNLSINFDENLIKPFAFPAYQDPFVKDDMAVDSLGILPVQPTHVVVRKKVDFYDLKVPHQFKVLSYDYHLHTSNVYRSVPKKLARELRIGAENELTMIDLTIDNPSTAEACIDSDIDSQVHNFISFQPTVPLTFLHPAEYHPLHIFNPLPGVQAHPQPLPYCETDDDYRLNPLPRVQPGVLDRQDVIPGAMTWKKFNSQTLISMNNLSVSAGYVPRWSDPFGEDMIPTTALPLLASLPDDDLTDFDDMKDTELVPTLEMVRAEFKMVDELQRWHDESEKTLEHSILESFTLPTTNNPQSNIGLVTREKLLQDLDSYLRQKQDNLGSRIKDRLNVLKQQWKLK